MSDKYYKQERAKQKNFKESEKAINKKYKQITEDETVFEYLNKLRPEDSTREYNEVEHYKNGGLVGRGQGRVIKTKRTKLY
jgi:hypothetical protein